MLTTINPIIPQNIINYASGFTNIGLKKFITTIALVSIPMNAIYTYLGASIGLIILGAELKKTILYFGISFTSISFIIVYMDFHNAKYKK